MTTRTYDYKLTLADASHFTEGRFVVGNTSGTVGEVDAVYKLYLFDLRPFTFITLDGTPSPTLEANHTNGGVQVKGVNSGATGWVFADGTGAAAKPVTTTVTYVSNTTGGNLYCDLANGTTEGQIKIIICTAIGGSSPVVKITPASIDTVNSFDLNAVGEAVTLLWHNAKWICIGAHMNAVTA